MNEHFSTERLWWLLRADFTAGYRPLLTVSATLAGVILIASLISSEATQDFFMSWYGGMLYIWGVIASSRAFRELHDKTRNEAYLLIPASAVEKTLARLLAVTVGLAVYLLVFTTAVSLVVASVHSVLPGPGYSLFNPFDQQLWPLIMGYFFLQSFFFLGAAWFRRRHFIKTALAMTLAGIGLILFLALAFGLALLPGNLADLQNFGVDLENFETVGSTAFRGLFRPLEIAGTIMTMLLPAACWTIAWLRVREAQVSDGV